MKTSSYTAKSQLHAAETSQQELRSIKRSGATLLLLFTALFALLFFSSCEDEDDKEEELRPDSLELIVGDNLEAIYNQTVKLDASQTYDKLDAAIDFKWEAVSFPGDHFLEEYLQQAGTATATFHPYDVGEFTFRVSAATEFETKTALLTVSVDAEVVELSGNLNDLKETWEPTTPPGMTDYRITGPLSLHRSEIDVAPGVVIEMSQNAYINVNQDSYLSAVGSEENPIIIRGREAIRGYWHSIRFVSNTSNNRLQYVEISDGGNNRNNDRGMITLGNEGRLHMERCTLSNATLAALELGIVTGNPDQHLTHIANVYKNNQRPVFARPDAFHFLDAESDYSGNDVDAIDANGALGTTPDAPVEWQALNVPYLAERIIIANRLTMKAGLHLKMAQASYIRAIDGQLLIEGEAENQVLIEGEHGGGATWLGIELASFGNHIDHLHIKNAGSAVLRSGLEKANIAIRSGSLYIENTHFEDGDGYGVYRTMNTQISGGDNLTATNLNGDLYNVIML